MPAFLVLLVPDVPSYRQLLEFVFQIHDPSTPNRQGNDRGMSHHSAIYYVSNEQKAGPWTPSPT